MVLIFPSLNVSPLPPQKTKTKTKTTPQTSSLSLTSLQAVQLHYEGESTDFIIYASSADAVKEYTEDPESSSLVATVDLYKIYTTNTPGNELLYHEASNVALHNEFGSHNFDDILKQIILKGKIIEPTR